MSKKTLNQTNLAALGADQLAALLMEVSTGSADIKRRLRLELSHNLGAAELAHDVRKRLASIRKSTSFVGWRRRKALIKDLNIQVQMIVDKIAPDDPTAAFDLLWQFIEMAPSVYGRVDDSKGDVGDVFHAAFAHFDDIAPRAIHDPAVLADRVWTALQDNGYGEWDGVIQMMAGLLGPDGLARLTANVQADADAPVADGSDDHDAIQFLRSLRGDDTFAASRKARFIKQCLQDIASVTGDTAAYIAQYSDDDLARKTVAAEVAMLLVGDGDARAALDLLLNANDGDAGQDAWDAAYIASLTALGRIEDAQAHRWACFTDTLNQTHLRDYLKLMADFEDIEAEEQARAHVLAFPSFSRALEFCLNWPDLLSAAQLIDTRAGEIDGDRYALLGPAAEALRLRHPLAAVTLWRAMIDCALNRGQSFRYGIAADYLADCASLDVEIADYGDDLTHTRYLQALQTRHRDKPAFWKNMR